MRTVICALMIVAVYATILNEYVTAAPLHEEEKIEEKLKYLQDELTHLQRQLGTPIVTEKQDGHKLLFNEWQPQKRLVAWQPMKRTVDERQPGELVI
uniref:U17-Nephitoxin-Nsp1a_1 n=1 Tax=Angiostrongylus cantonensis TaxID=6313 RepID=A0A0K0DP82_ANGCA